MLAFGCIDPQTTPNEEAFSLWLRSTVVAHDGDARDLVYAYFDTDTHTPWFLSPSVTAEAIRYWLDSGAVDQARRSGDALLKFQHPLGAFPSEIVLADDHAEPADMYDSADTLAVIAALLDLLQVTHDPRYLEAAARAGIWIRDVMMHGETRGLWVDPYGAPMKAMTAAGDFDNRIAVGRTLFWIAALGRLGERLGDSSFAAAENQARTFLASGRHGAAYFDHYDPGWPAHPFDQSRFRAAGIDNSVYADDSLRAAVGAFAAGDINAADRLSRWLTVEDGGIFGYLGLETGAGRFVAGDAPYYDVIASALFAQLCQELGDPVDDAMRFLANTQSPNGGWYWGRVASTGEPITSDQATLTGLWAATIAATH